MKGIEILGLIAGFCTSSSIIPQLVKTIKRKKSEDVSVVMFLILLAGNGLWLYYGANKSDIPIITTNSLALLLNLAMLFLKFKYRNN